jgi:hypothetical protein
MYRFLLILTISIGCKTYESNIIFTDSYLQLINQSDDLSIFEMDSTFKYEDSKYLLSYEKVNKMINIIDKKN